jgi:hypothetical protein
VIDPLRRIRRIEIVHDPSVGIDFAVLLDPPVRPDPGGALGGRSVGIPRQGAGDQIEVIGKRAAVNALEPPVQQDELVGQLPLRRARIAIEVAHRGPAARALGHPPAHRDAVGAGAVLTLHVIEAVDWIVRRIERRDVLLQEKGRVGQIGGEARIGFAVAPERSRQGRVRDAVLVGLPPAVAFEPVRARIAPEEMIEAAVLHEQDDDVIDRHRCGRRLTVRSAGGARAQDERSKRDDDEAWTTISHGVF